jgi:hypothetical protein
MMKGAFICGKICDYGSVGIQEQVKCDCGKQDHNDKQKFAPGENSHLPVSEISDQRNHHECTAKHIAETCVKNKGSGGETPGKHPEISQKRNQSQDTIYDAENQMRRTIFHGTLPLSP